MNMNRRGFLKLLGVGIPVAIVAPSVLAKLPPIETTNVRHLISKIRDGMEDALQQFLFEPNDDITRANVQLMVNQFLEDMKKRRAIIDGKAICNLANNPPSRIDEGYLAVDVYVKPTHAVEHVALYGAISKKGVDFCTFT